MRLPEDLQTMLDGCGLPWRIEPVGSAGHRGRLVIGDQVVGVLAEPQPDNRRGLGRHRGILQRAERVIKEVKQEEERASRPTTTIFSGG